MKKNPFPLFQSKRLGHYLSFVTEIILRLKGIIVVEQLKHGHSSSFAVSTLVLKKCRNICANYSIVLFFSTFHSSLLN